MEPRLSTHVRLFDLEGFPTHAMAAGEGGDEAEALLDLWTTLTDRQESGDTITYDAEAYAKRTERQPGRQD